jgi:hypothetical protein
MPLVTRIQRTFVESNGILECKILTENAHRAGAQANHLLSVVRVPCSLLESVGRVRQVPACDVGRRGEGAAACVSDRHDLK